MYCSLYWTKARWEAPSVCSHFIISYRSYLQSRDTPPNAAAVKELDLDLSLWQPLIVDRQFVSWLVKEPTEQVQAAHEEDTTISPT